MAWLGKSAVRKSSLWLLMRRALSGWQNEPPVISLLQDSCSVFPTPLILFLETLEHKHVSQPESGSAVNRSVSFDRVETEQYISPLKAHFSWVCLYSDFKHIQTPTYIFLYMFLFLCSQRSQQHQTAGLTHAHTQVTSSFVVIYKCSLVFWIHSGFGLCWSAVSDVYRPVKRPRWMDTFIYRGRI